MSSIERRKRRFVPAAHDRPRRVTEVTERVPVEKRLRGGALRRTGGSSGTVSVDYATASGSATSGADFTAASGTLTWSDGDTADKTIEIRIAADSAGEDAEDFRIVLSNPSGGASLATSQLTVQIAGQPVSNPPPGPPPPGSGDGGGGGGAIDWWSLAWLLLALITMPRSAPVCRLHAGWRETR